MAPSRSIFERFAALMLVGGVLLSSLAAGVHDPGCPHHAPAPAATSGVGEAGHSAVAAPASAHAAHGAAPAAASQHHGADPGAEDCRCVGGLCALSAVLEPPLPAAGPAAPALVARTETLPPTAASTVRPLLAGLLPPATGPPVRI